MTSDLRNDRREREREKEREKERERERAQTWRIIHLLLEYTRNFQTLMLIFLQFDIIDYGLQG